MEAVAVTIDRATVLEALSAIAAVPEVDGLADDVNLLERGYIDSTQFLNLLALLEERSGMEIDFLEVDASRLTSVAGLVGAFAPPEDAGDRIPLASTMGVRAARQSEQDEIGAAITLAFGADPLMRWILPNPLRRLRFLGKLAGIYCDVAIECETAHVIGDFAGVALWMPPGAAPDAARLRALFAEEVDPHRLRAYFDASERLGTAQPDGPHWSLPLIGVDPGHMGRGYGRALLEHGLSLCDRDRLPAYLESTNPANLPFYERAGFRVVAESQAEDCPARFALLRDPR